MKNYRATTTAALADNAASRVILGCIPGLGRLLPGHYGPGETVRSRYGRWTLPRTFRGNEISAIVDGTIFG
jgi:hypothetical protein